MLLAVLILVPANANAALNAQDSNKLLSQKNTIDHSIVVKEDTMSDLNIITEDGN